MQDEVHVPEPYTASSCKAVVSELTNPKALERVQLVIADARQKLGL
jgi:hypothetical protein